MKVQQRKRHLVCHMRWNNRPTWSSSQVAIKSFMGFMETYQQHVISMLEAHVKELTPS